ncbi:DUF1481 domain-containing protein [Pantoea coffeiphila]|uniref:DUF1481 domain-containing protein n=1 Tax=Pantoea coffeiphila TaxID=1465635 RepID=A0A2S9I3Z2_9GAMM|nr:hypothetical protein CQW29_26130 [Pantoea coffeiphila]
MMKLTLPNRISILTILLLLAGCSSHSDLPDFTASGYLADRGAVRIWRKDSQEEISHMMTAYTPFSGGATETTDYQWLDGKPVAIERHVSGKQPDDVTLRFDHDGALSFMQRQLAGHREPLSADEVALYQFDAQRMLKISNDLRNGRVMLIQGRWLPGGEVASCQGNQLRPEFDEMELEQIARQRASASAEPVNVAWLQAPEGVQLLLVSHEDLCQSEPKEADF